MGKKLEKNEIFVHIKSDSKYVSSNEIISEEKAVKRLEDIRNNFSYMKKRFDKKGTEKLTVKTCVHNPTLL